MRIRVLIADDEEMIREALTELIRAEEGLELVGVAADVTEAVDQAARHRPDVAVLDVRMPGGGGPRAAREILERTPATRIVAFSAYEDRTTVLEMLKAGAVAYLVKGSPGSTIVEGIRRSALGQSTLSAEVTGDVVNELANQLTREAAEAEQHEYQERRIRGVMEGDGIRTVFQPILDLRTRDLVGLEALTRFEAEASRPPDQWFAEAGEIGLGGTLEIAALAAALRHLDRVPASLYVSLNLSPGLLDSAAFLEAVAGADPDRLVVEVTEHAPVEDYEAIGAARDALRARGIRLAIDDAGAGFASLRHILRLDPEIIKLDITLTRNIDASRAQRALARALISFASEIEATIVAEGIETRAEIETLRDLGVSFGQGFYLARPAPLERILPARAVG